jgi:hypothetical protein
MNKRARELTEEDAELIAIRGLQYIATDDQLLQRFLALSGVAPQDLRDAASSHAFLSGVLDFFMGDEATLLAFTASIGEQPEIVARARRVLSQSGSGANED